MKTLVVDDHPLIREALHNVLAELGNYAVVLEAADSRRAIELAEQHPDLDLILLDLSLPDRDGFGLLAELRERFPAVAVVVQSAYDEPGNIVRALDLGAVGFIPKNAQREVMLGALRLVCAGGTYIPVNILPGRRPAPSTVPDRFARRPADLGLTGRQLDVLASMIQGNTNKEIGRQLGLAEPTVKTHVTAILKALEVTNRTQAVIALRKLGLQWPGIAGS